MTHAAALEHHSRAYQLHLNNRVDEAIRAYQQALDLDPAYREAWSNLGLAFLALKRPEEAMVCERQALRLDPDSADAQNNLGMILYVQGHIAEAENCFRSALRLDPGHANATLNLGSMRHLHNRVEEAEALFRHALTLGVEASRGRNNLGLALIEQNKLAEAERCLRRALALDPGNAQARANLSLVLLATGRLAEGWQEFESRWQVEAMGGGVPTLAQPRWTGQPLEGKSIVLWAEQGFGDMLQFCRYVPMVAELGARVVLVAPKALHRVMATLGGVAELRSEADEVLPAFDYHCPLMSLPFAFDTTLETIPAAVPYLSGDRAPWAGFLGGLPGLKVGLVWAGKSREAQPHAVAIDKRRSMRLSDMLPLLSVPGCSFVSLQLGPPSVQMVGLPDGAVLLDVSDRLGDWADTAGLMMGLDLVITVDTAVAHLAGALGRPVWMLNRFDSCWRWLTEGDDTAWYPTMRLFRQTERGDWAGVIERVRLALTGLAR